MQNIETDLSVKDVIKSISTKLERGQNIILDQLLFRNNCIC